MEAYASTLPALIPDMPEDYYHRVLTAAEGWFSAGAGKAIEDGCDNRALHPFAGNASTKQGRCVHAMVEAHIKGRPIRGFYPADGNPDPSRGTQMTKKEWDICEKAAKSLITNPISRHYIEAATESELTALWEQDGVRNKARIDDLTGLDIIDFKTARSVRGNAFQSSAHSLGYDLSARHYLEAPFGFRKYIFIVVEMGGNFYVRKYEYDLESLEVAGVALKSLRARFKRAYETGFQACYPNETVYMRSARAMKAQVVEVEEEEEQEEIAA